jgi:hypothetical protein
LRPPIEPNTQTHQAPDAAELLRLGDAAFASGEYTAAVRHYSDAIDADPATPLFYTKRAAAHISLRHQAQALKVCCAAPRAPLCCHRAFETLLYVACQS